MSSTDISSRGDARRIGKAKAGSKPKDTKSLTVREAYEMHKLVGDQEKKDWFMSGYMKGYYEATLGKPNRYDDYFDREAVIAGNDLAMKYPEAKND